MFLHKKLECMLTENKNDCKNTQHEDVPCRGQMPDSSKQPS
jgi:hypothetical protein